MRAHLSLLWASLAVTALGSPTIRHRPHQVRDTSTAWTKLARAPRDAIVPVHVALSQNNLERGAEALMELSDPTSPKYANHWTMDEVREAFAPSSASIDQATSWLTASGISTDRLQRSHSRGGIGFSATVQELEELTLAEYHIYEHPRLGLAFGCDQYHVPTSMFEHIDFITPGVGLAGARNAKRETQNQKRDTTCPSNGNPTLGFKPAAEIPKSFDLANCSSGVFPACINALYDVPSEPPCHSDSSIGIFAPNQTYLQQDLDIFFSNFTSYIPAGTTPDTHFINGGELLQEYVATGTFEADLDVQMAWSLVYPQKLSFYNVNPSLGQYPLFLHLNLTKYHDQSIGVISLVDDLMSAFDKTYCNDTTAECGTVEVPTVLSISYAPEELAVPEASARRLCNEFMKLSLQGTTIVAASGDWGVAQLSNEPNVCIGKDNKIFNPSMLASCPWVTAVGATQINANQSIDSAESAASIAAPGVPFYSGGGFSNYYTVPAYQKDNIAHYFQQSPPPYPTYQYNGSQESIGANGGLYNRHGRGYPDVSTIGSNIYTVAGGCFGVDGGTSYSTPIFGGLVSRINAERMAVGKKSLGFINPALYAKPDLFNDIVTGHSRGCGSGDQGFAAVEGWDPITGLGTPKFPQMMSYFMSLP